MRRHRTLLIVALAQTLLGCGQKGPLVLPDAQHPRKKIVAPTPRAPGTAAPAPSPTVPPAPTPPS